MMQCCGRASFLLQVMGMTRDAFNKMPAWRQANVKKNQQAVSLQSGECLSMRLCIARHVATSWERHRHHRRERFPNACQPMPAPFSFSSSSNPSPSFHALQSFSPARCLMVGRPCGQFQGLSISPMCRTTVSILFIFNVLPTMMLDRQARMASIRRTLSLIHI